ncbi:hypothetical protein GCM10027049_00690 [Mucilaginibacter puniceus]
MKQSRYAILLSLKTPTGFITYGQYYLGDDRQFADDVFNQLQGSREITPHTLLHIDMMETVDELPQKIKTIGCTLDELAHNIKLIAREIFKLKNLEDMDP